MAVAFNVHVAMSQMYLCMPFILNKTRIQQHKSDIRSSKQPKNPKWLSVIMDSNCVGRNQNPNCGVHEMEELLDHEAKEAFCAGAELGKCKEEKKNDFYLFSKCSDTC